MTMERVNVSRYLEVLRDPLDGGRLKLEGDALLGETSGKRYEFKGPFPDLRLDEDKGRVMDHYDDAPCHNYIALDNLPLGRYYRETSHEHYFKDRSFVVEIGAGKGAMAQVMKDNRGITSFCIDLAYGSLRHTRNPPLEADGALGSALNIPLADNCADLVVCSGVIHHTPDPMRCVIELARILKPGGHLMLGVYNWENLYRSLYFFLSPPLKGIRHFLGPRAGDLVIKGTIFIPYQVALWMVLGMVQGRWKFPKIKESYEQFGDFFLTPIARFYHARELKSLGDVVGLDLLEHETGGWPNNGFSHFAWYRKKLLSP
jgi:SAM-dependent methyltransferase